MKPLTIGSGVLVAILVLAAHAGAADEALIPPGNSAVNQYTESFPTAGGNKTVDGKRRRPPAKVLGRESATKLQRRGPDGRAVAELAAETATAPPGAGGAVDAAGDQGAAAPGGSGDGGAPSPPGAGDAAGDSGASVPRASGSSGLGEALEQATGVADSGAMGPMLPLLLLAVLLGSIAYLLRRRKTGP